MSMPSNITGVILAGGRGTRMGGVDKGLVKLEGKPLVEHVLHRLQPQVPHIIISANRNQDEYACYGFPVISDAVESNDAGPLAGIFSALTHATTEYILTVPCDAPRLPHDLAARLLRQLQQRGTTACMAHDGTRAQPMFTLLHTGLRDEVLRALRAGEHKVGLWLQQRGSSSADFSDCAECFINLNTAENIAEVKSHE